MPRYVILQHDHPELHWDLMLESDGVLRTWRLPAPPSDHPTTALALGDHRIAYLEYEGPVSGNRGQVKRWDRGDYETLEQSESAWRVRLRAERWQGTLALELETGQAWTAHFAGSDADNRKG